jgi:hypothetical protein
MGCSTVAGERDRTAIAYYLSHVTKGDCFAKAHISTATPPARQDARLPRSHEDEGRPQSAGGAPQEGTSSAYPRIIPGTRCLRPVLAGKGIGFRVKRGWCGVASLMLSTAPESAVRVPTLQFFSAPTNCRRAVSDSASRRPWAARWCAIVSGGDCAR